MAPYGALLLAYDATRTAEGGRCRLIL